MTDIPQPVSPRPWSQQPGKPPIYDKNLRPVSFVQNAPWLFHIEQLHDPMIAVLKQARADILMGRRSQKTVDLITGLLARAGAE